MSLSPLCASPRSWIINRPVPVASMDPTALSDAFLFLSQYLLPPSQAPAVLEQLAALNVTNPALVAELAAAVAAWMAPGEALAPQTVEFAPFPILAYEDNAFYDDLSGLFSFFFVITLLYPVSRLIRGLVMEKETRIREAMRMMGLADSALIGSWVTTYVLLFAFLAAAITVLTKRNVFNASNGGAVFIFFFLYGLSAISYAYLVSVFFNRAKAAGIIGILLFFAGYFPYYVRTLHTLRG
jgi:hypothetical protein